MTGRDDHDEKPVGEEPAERPHGNEAGLAEEADRTVEEVPPAPGAPMQRGENR